MKKTERGQPVRSGSQERGREERREWGERKGKVGREDWVSQAKFHKRESR